MGANMILAICRVPETVSAEEVEAVKERARTLAEDAPERFGYAAEEVLNAEWDAVEEAAACWEGEGLSGEEIGKRTEVLHRDLVARRISEAMDELVVPLIPMTDDERRERQADLPSDTIHHELAGSHYLMTGGPTWGDPPTGSYDAVALLDASGLLRGLCEAEEAARARGGTTGHGE